MADQQRRVSLIFDADASKAKQAINELGNSLNNIMNISSRSFNVASIDKDLRKAGQSAALLQTQLKQAMNVNTGKLDLTKFNDSLKASGMSLEKYQQTFMNIGPAGERAFNNLARSIATAEIPLRRSSALLNDFSVSLKNTVKWQLSSSLMHGFLSTIQSAMTYAQNLNSNLNDIRIVTGQSAEEMARFAEQANRSAKELSSTTNQYAQAALIFYQQGLGNKQVKERTDAVIKMANVTGEAAKDVSSYMTAIWNNFDDGSKSLEYYADVITKLGATTAASSEEIAGGLEKFAAIGNTIGLSYEYATAMITTIVDKTRQSEDVVGTALKTILARIQGLNLGETLEDGTTLNKYSEALATVGVQIKDTTGQIRDMDSILNDLGAKWQTLGKDTQIALAQVVGGVRQYNQIISLMDNWDAFEMNVNIALDSEGELNKQAEIYAESWEAAKRRVQASLETIYSSLLDDSFFIGFNNVLAEVLEQVNNLIKGLGGVKGVVVTLGTVLMTVFNQQITASLKNFTHNLQMMTKTGQQRLVALQQESQNLLAKMGSDKGTIGGGIIADAYVQEANAQKQLLAVSEKLSAVERETANTLMRQVQLRTDQQVSAGQNASIAQQELEMSVMALERLHNNLSMSPVGLDDIISKINIVSTAAPQMASFYEQAGLIINNTNIDMATKMSDLRALAETMDESMVPDIAKQGFEELKAVLAKTSPSMEAVKNALNNFMSPIDNVNQEIEVYITKLHQKAQAELESGKGNEAEALKYIKLADALERVTQKATTYGEALQKAGVAQLNSAQATKILNEFLKGTGIHVMTAQEKIVSYARILGTLAMTINQIKGLIEVWEDDTKSLGEKLLTTATTLSMLIPMIMSSVTAIKNLGISAMAAKLALKNYSAAAIEGAASSITFSTALHTAMGPIGWIIAAITALVGALVLLNNEAKKAEEASLGNQAKKIAESYERAADSAKELKDTSAEIYSQFEKYNQIVETLASCTEGTQAWRNAMLELSNLASAMLENYPLLMDMLNNPIAYGIEGLRREDGSIDYGKLLESFYGIQTDIELGGNLYTNRKEEETKEIRDQVSLRGEAYGLADKSSYHSDKGLGAAYNKDSYLEDYVETKRPELGTGIFSKPTISETVSTIWGEFLLYAQKEGASKVSESLFTSFLDDEGLSEIFGLKGLIPSLGKYLKMDSVTADTSVYAFFEKYRGGNFARDNEWLFGQTTKVDMSESPFIGINNTKIAQMSDYLPLLTSVTKDTPIAHLFENQAGNFGNAALFEAAMKEIIPSTDIGMNYLAQAPDAMLLHLMQSYGITGVTTAEQAREIFEYSHERGGAAYNKDDITISSETWDQMAMSYALSSMPNGILSDTLNSVFSKLSSVEQKVISNSGDIYGTLSYAEIKEQQSAGQSGGLIDWSQVYTPSEISVEQAWNSVPASQYDKFIGMPSEYSTFLGSITNFDPTLLSSLLDIDLSQGYKSLRYFTDTCEELGIVINKSSSEYKNFEEALLKGHLPIEMYDGFTASIDELTSSMIKAKEEGIDTEAVEQLSSSGFDTSKLVYQDGKYYGNVDPTEYFTELHKADQYADWVTTDESGNYKWDIPEGKLPDSGELALESGYNPLSTSTPEFFEHVLEYKDAFRVEDAQAASQFGFQFVDILKEQGYADEFMEAMAFAQAQIDGIDWETLIGFDEDGKIVSEIEYLAAKTALDVEQGFLDLVNNYATYAKDGLGKILAQAEIDGEFLTTGEKELLSNLKNSLGQIFGVGAEAITNEMIIENWKFIEDMLSGTSGGVQFGGLAFVDQLKEQGALAQDYDPSSILNALERNTAEKVEQKPIYSSNISRTVDDFVAGNLLNSSLEDLNKAGKLLVDGVKDSIIKGYLQNADLIDDKGLLTDKARQLGYDTVKQLQEDYLSSIKMAQAQLNSTPMLSDIILEQYNEIWSGIKDVDKNLTGQRAISSLLNKAFKEGGTPQLEFMSKVLQDAGGKAGKLASELNSIDWNSASVSDLQNTFNDLGISIPYTESELQAFINAMNDAAEATTTATEAISKYAELMGLIEGLTGEEGKISSDDMNTLSDSGLYSYDQLREMFTANADGTYTINDKEQSNDIAWALLNQQQATLSAQAASASQLATNLSQASQYLNTGFESGNEENVTQAYLDAARWASSDASKYQDVTYMDELGNIYGFSDAVANLESSNPEDVVKGIQMFEALGRNLGGFEEDLLDIAEQSEFEAERLGEMATNTPDEFINNQLAQATDMVSLENVSDDISSQIGQQFENTEEYSKALLKLAENYETVQDELQAYQEALEEGDEQQIESTKKALKMAMSQEDFRKEMTRSSKSIQDHIKNMKKWTKEYGDQSKEFDEYKKEVEGVQKELSKLFGKKIDSKFIVDNLEDIQLAAEGDEEAFQRLQDKVTDQYGPLEIKVDDSELFAMEDSMTKLQNWINEMDLEVDVHGYADMDSLVNGIIQAVFASKNIIDAFGEEASNEIAKIQAELNSSFEGYNFTIEQTGTQTQEVGKQTNVVMGYKTGHYDQIPSDATGVPTRHFTSYRYPESVTTTPITEERPVYTTKVDKGGYSRNPYSGTSSASRPRGGGGGGGGGGGSRAPQAEKKQSSDKERYHTVTNQLEDLTDAYDKVSKAADRAFGKSRIKLLREQQDALKDLAATQQDYIDEINDYYQQDLSNLDQVSQYVGFDVQLDENGTITNFDAIQDAMWDEYNSHINDDGEVTDMDEEAWKEYEEEWERIMALIEQYEDTQDKRKEALQQLQDYINEIYDLQLEEVTYAVEVDIEASDDALEILDYLLTRIEDDAWKAAEAIAYMGNKAATMLDQNNTYTSGIRDILMNHTEDIRDSEGRLLQKAQLTQADVEGFMAGDAEALSKLMGLNDAFTEEEIQSLRDYHNSLIEMNETLIELRESVFDKVLESFEQFNEEMDKSIDKIDHLSAVTDNYKNIIDIVGKKNLNISNALLDSLNQASTEQRINRVEATKTKRDTIAAEIATAEAALMNARANGLEEDAKLWEKTLEEMRVSLDEAEEDFMQSWEDALDGIRQQFEEAVGHAIETLSDALAGPLMGSLDELQEAFDRQNTITERYLPDYEKIYELNKLNRDITNSIDETDNIKAKQELAALQAEINALEESEAQISEYQMENLRRRYELKLAEIALTEAQDAKSQVQMSRDADGNWSYVYTANEDQVAEAEQTYEDRLFAMQEANAEYMNTLSDNIVQLKAEMLQKIEEIMMDETLSAEEQMTRVQEVLAFSQEQMQYYMDELGLVLGENQILYEEDWTKYSELTGYKISANEDYVDNFNETALSTLTGFQTMQEFQQNFNDAIGHPDSHGLLYDLSQAYETWANNTEAAMNAAGTSVQDFADDMAEDVDDIVEASEEATDAIEDMGEKVEETFADLTTAVQNWSNEYSRIIDEMLQKNTALAESFNKLLQAYSDYTDASTDDTTDAPEDTTDNSNIADEGADVSDSVAEKTEKYKKGIAFAIWAHPSSGWGHGNSSRNLTSGDRYDRLKAKGLDPNTVQQQINAYRGKSTDYMKKDSGINFKEWGDRVAALNPYTYKKFAFDTGGYTGEWGGEGRWAMLHEKEIVLNKDDTANLLTAIDIIRQISKTIDLNAYSSAGYGNSLIRTGMGSAGTLEQHVQITAEFPNATNREEIYSAFTDIINLASQYANKK